VKLFRKRRRKMLGLLGLGLWLFALSVSIAHACGLDGGGSHAGQAVTGIESFCAHDGAAPAGCDQSHTDRPAVLAKPQTIQEPLGEQALLLASVSSQPFLTGVAPVAALLHRPHPSPGIALNTRFVRLAL
jgi:hypothetical protein